MKIIREKTTKNVIYFLHDNDEVILSSQNLSGEVTDVTITSLTHEIVENVKPLNFNPKFGQLKYDTNFNVVDQTAYNIKETTFNIQQKKDAIKSQITAIEESITPRRQREAILSIDTTWLADIEIQIGQLRQQLAEYDNA
jgi:hypothetical protein